MSHTVKVKVNMSNAQALIKAAEASGAQVLGEGTHRLFQGPVTGFGLMLKGWNYPMVIDMRNGEASYDNYNGAWGDIGYLTALQESYTVFAAQEAAIEQGWYNEINERGELIINHPSGGTIMVTKQGVIDATGFIGESCSSATQPIENALGGRTSEVRKSEYNQSHLTVGEND